MEESLRSHYILTRQKYYNEFKRTDFLQNQGVNFCCKKLKLTML